MLGVEVDVVKHHPLLRCGRCERLAADLKKYGTEKEETWRN
jgi:hypothetical protein